MCLSGYAFRRASTYEADIWQVGRSRQLEVCWRGFDATREVKGHVEVNLSRNAL